MIKEQQQKSRSDSIRSAGSFINTTFLLQDCNHSAEELVDGALLLHECDDVKTTNSRSQSVGWSKLGYGSGTTSEDEEHTSMSSIKPRPPSEHDSLTPKEKPRPHSSSIVVVDNSPLNPVSELERVDILRSAKSPSSLRLIWSTCFARYCECFAPWLTEGLSNRGVRGFVCRIRRVYFLIVFAGRRPKGLNNCLRSTFLWYYFVCCLSTENISGIKLSIHFYM